MADRLPGWTCPDIDATLRLLRQWRQQGKITAEDFQEGSIRLEGLRNSNRQLRTRCAELLQERQKGAGGGKRGTSSTKDRRRRK